jgi:RNA-directed DNA polymerase
VSEEQAQAVKRSIEARLQRCQLELHPDKTKIVYCKDDDRRGAYPHEKFDFLGYTFRPRRSKNRWGRYFINFSPAVSDRAATKMRQTMRRWRLHLRSDKALDDLARMWNPVLRGWINYYGRFYKSALNPVFRHLNQSHTELVGVEEIQKATWSQTPRPVLARRGGPTRTPDVRSLGPPGTQANGWMMGAV